MKFPWRPTERIAIGYAAIAVVGALLLMLPIARTQPIGFLDAIFTASSATFVTGLTTVTTATAWTIFGKTVIALLIQIGGWGITLITTLIYLVLGRKITIGERQFMAEDKNWRVHGIVRLVKSIFVYSMAIEGVGAVIFALYFHFRYHYAWSRAIGYAVFHSVSAFNNAGFDLWGNSLEGFASDPILLILTGLLIIIGGLGFIVLTEISSYRATKRLSLHTRIVLKMTWILLLVGTILGLLFEANHSMHNLNWLDKIVNAWFFSVTLRTAGFDSVPFGSMTEVTLLISLIFMFIGASPGSTGGGIKTTTFYMMVKVAVSTIRGREHIVSRQRTIPWDLAKKSLVIFLLASAYLVVITMLDAIFEPSISIIKILFEEVSAFGTVGLTTGITPTLGEPMRWVLIFTMYIGRVGLLTFLISLARPTRTHARYLEEKILIG